MTTVSDEFLLVLRQAHANDGWMKRSQIIKAVYGDDMPINAHHRDLLDRLMRSGQVTMRVKSYMHNSWFEYKAEHNDG